MIIFNKVTTKFKDGTVVLREISFTINKGEFVFLIGPSGAGKTTVSRLLIREIVPSKGRIFIDNEEITKLKNNQVHLLRCKVGTAFQDFKLLLDRTVEENVSLSLEIVDRKDVDIKDRVQKIIKLVGLQGKEHLFPGQLSGGEIQRVVIARAICHSPKILFADEPTGNLDRETGWQIIELLKRINEEGTTVIVATHNVEVVDTLSQRVIRLEKGEIKTDQTQGKYEAKHKEHKPEKPEKKMVDSKESEAHKETKLEKKNQDSPIKKEVLHEQKS